MLRLSDKKKKTAAMAGVWEKAGAAINAKARRWAGWLNAKAGHASRGRIRLVLVVFCLYGGTASTYVIVKAVQHKQTSFTVTAVSVPKQINVLPLQDTALQAAIGRIEKFRHSAVYDSLVKTRPGLKDSIAFIEQYYSTFKK